jgi:recombination DNA repair RAD52 pathway protein
MTVDLNKLTEPFPQTAIKQRQGGGGRALSYVEGHTVIHRLIAATENNYSFRVLAIETRTVQTQRGTATLVTATVELELPGLGARQHIGVQMVNDAGGEDLVKGAITDALKKAATLFGIGLELYGPDYESGEIAAPVQRSTPRPAVRGRQRRAVRWPAARHGVVIG